MVDIELESEDLQKFSEEIETRISNVFLDAMNEVFMLYGAFQEAGESARSKVKTRSFSECHGELMEVLRKVNNGELQDIPERKLQCHEGDLKTLQKLLNVRHEFVVSMDTMDDFCEEVWILYKTKTSSVPELYLQGTLREAEFRLAKEKALFAMGKAVSMLREAGKVKSDIPTKAGRSKWKNKVSKQEIIEEFYRIDTNGKSENKICEGIQKAFLKRGYKKDDVYSTKWIKSILKDEWPKIQ
jgi:hypothetical protein